MIVLDNDGIVTTSELQLKINKISKNIVKKYNGLVKEKIFLKPRNMFFKHGVYRKGMNGKYIYLY